MVGATFSRLWNTGCLFSQHSFGQMWLWKTDEFWWSSCTLTNIPLFEHAVISEKCRQPGLQRLSSLFSTPLPAHKGLVIMGVKITWQKKYIRYHSPPFCSFLFFTGKSSSLGQAVLSAGGLTLTLGFGYSFCASVLWIVVCSSELDTLSLSH